MSAARAAARNKPVVAIRSPGAEAAHAATPNCSTDQIYEAAMRRAGWVRIVTLEGLFEAAEALAWVRMPRGENLAILANGRGLGRIAADAFLHEGGRLTEFSPATRTTLAKLLHQSTRLSNPLAMAADTSPGLWATALTTVLADPATDAVLTISSPTAFNNSAEIAQAICAVAARSDLNIFTCWTGGASMLAARQVAAACNVLSFDAPEKATLVFQRVVSYARNRELLAQLPVSQRSDFQPDDKLARGAVAESIALGNELMPLRQARRLLQAYCIAASEPVTAASIENAANAANEIGYPVDLDLTLNHVAQDVSAPLIVPGLRSAEEVRIAARGLRSRVRAEQPTARVSGYRLRPGAPHSGIPPLRLGIADDPVFGPIIYLGLSNTLAHRSRGCAVALPPLNHALAHDLVARAGIIDDVPEQKRAPLESTICDAIVRLSQLLTDIDEVATVELDPLHVEATSVVAINFRLHLEHHLRRSGFRRFAIRPYPKELECHLDWDGGSLLIRPIRPNDDAALGELITSLDTDDARMRFFGTMRGLPASQLARFTQIDYDREMALVAIERITKGNNGNDVTAASPRLLGEVRVVADPDNHAADFAIVVRSGLKGKGLGRLLLQNIIDYARQRGITELRGETFAENLRMQRLAEHLGFTLNSGSDPGTVNLRLALQAAGVASR
jgi:acetyltransferase